MEKNEYLDQLQVIDSVREQTKSLFPELENFINNISGLQNLLAKLKDRDNNFKEYLKLLEDFNFDSAITTPSDLFPGIRTVADTVNTDEMNTKVEAMKNLASKITTSSTDIDVSGKKVVSDLKRCIGSLSELMILENQIYDMNLDLLSDLNSIYDIGQISTATK